MISTTFDARLKSQAEKTFCESMEQSIKKLVEEKGYPITDIRFARKVKCFGAETYGLHLYRYRGTSKLEVWVNLHGITPDERTAEIKMSRVKMMCEQLYGYDESAVTPEMVQAYLASRNETSRRVTAKVKRFAWAFHNAKAA